MRLLSGQRAWILQRLSAAYLLLVITAGMLWLLVFGSPGFDAWRSFTAHPAGALTLLLFYAAMFLHAWVRLRDIVLDYVHAFAVRAVLLVAIAGALLALGGWTVLILVAARGTGY